MKSKQSAKLLRTVFLKRRGASTKPSSARGECEEASQRLAEKIKSIALELDRAMGEIEAKEKERAAYKGKLDDAGAQIIALRQEIASLRHASDSLTKERVRARRAESACSKKS